MTTKGGFSKLTQFLSHQPKPTWTHELGLLPLGEKF